MSPEAGKREGEQPLIAIVTDRFPVLSETFVVNEALELQRRGHEVLVEASERPEDAPPPPADLPVRYLANERRSDKLRGLLTLTARHPIRVIGDVAARRRWRREETVRPLRQLAARAGRLRSAGVDHLHVHFAAEAALDSMRLARILGLPYSVTAHAYEIFMSPANLAEKLESAAFVTTGCEYNARHLRSLIDPGAAERVHVIVMGVDPDEFARTTPYPGGRHVVAIGRLVEKKGFGDLIDAVANLEADGEAIDHLTIVGEGPLRDELERSIVDRALGDRVSLPGSRSPAEIRGILESADLLAMPCCVAADGDRDSMPVVVKEAMAMAVPVVATDEVGLTELIEPEFGRLVPPRDPVSLAQGIADLLAVPAEARAEMGRRARAHAIERCDLRRETARLAELIDGDRTA